MIPDAGQRIPSATERAYSLFQLVSVTFKRNRERKNMDTYNAILRAANHMELSPKLFDFSRTRVPNDCRAPGCALGWIGFFAGRTQVRIRGLFGLSFLHHGIAIVTPEGGSDPVITVIAREFYERMDSFEVGDWRQDAAACAEAMRLYAERYHRPGELDPAYLTFRSTVVPRGADRVRQLEGAVPG